MKKLHNGSVNRTETLRRRNATIKDLKKERKSLLKSIEEIERDKKEDITSLIQDSNKVVSELQNELILTKRALCKSMKRKWYQFQKVE